MNTSQSFIGRSTQPLNGSEFEWGNEKDGGGCVTFETGMPKINRGMQRGRRLHPPKGVWRETGAIVGGGLSGPREGAG